MNRNTTRNRATKSTLVDLVTLRPKSVGRPPKTKFRKSNEPQEGSSTDKLALAKDIGAMFSQVKWSKVTLDSRKTYSVHAQLTLNGAGIFDAADERILITCRQGLVGVAGVEFNAPAAGDHFLITFFVDVIADGTALRLATYGDTPDQALELKSGNHEIPVVAIPSIKGTQNVQLMVQEDDYGFYLHRIEIQPL